MREEEKEKQKIEIKLGLEFGVCSCSKSDKFDETERAISFLRVSDPPFPCPNFFHQKVDFFMKK